MENQEIIIGDSREYLYENILSKNCICAEVGVDSGVNAERINNISKPKELYLIDAWDYSKYRNLPEHYRSQELKEKTQNIYEKVIDKFKGNKNIKIIRELSADAVKNFKDNYFAWVYIDAGHDYPYVKEDLNIWWPKVKGGGCLCGHDYNNGGVYSAVNEFIVNNKLELCYKGKDDIITNSTGQISDWCIKKK